MAAKRSRAEWEDCQDLAELKEHLAGLQARVDKLSKENASLKKVVKASEAAEPDESPQALAAHATKMRAAIKRQIEGTMGYKKKYAPCWHAGTATVCLRTGFLTSRECVAGTALPEYQQSSPICR